MNFRKRRASNEPELKGPVVASGDKWQLVDGEAKALLLYDGRDKVIVVGLNQMPHDFDSGTRIQIMEYIKNSYKFLKGIK